MADIRINALATTAASTASDDFVAVDGSANGTRKLNAFSPTFGGNLTVSGTGTSSFSGTVKILGPTNYTRIRRDDTVIDFTNAAENAYADGQIVGNTIAIKGNNGTGLTIGTSGQGTLAGTLTVSGTGLSSAAGTLFVGSSSPVDSGNGKLQLATHTTSAGGIGFGTDLSLYRANTGFLILNDASAALDARIGLYNNGTQRGLFEAYNVGTAVYIGAASASWSTIITSGNGTTALTLDSSQNATFAKDVTIGAKTGAQSTPDKLQMSSGYPNTSTPTNQQLKISLGYVSATQNYGFTTDSIARIWYHAGDTVGPTGGHVFATGGIAALTLDSSQNATFAGNIKTAAPSGGTAATWRLGTVATVSPTSPNRTIEVEIGGTTYYIHAKTTNN